jgi:heptosyltransferase I
MAVTQRVPVIGLYAHSNPRRTGPYLYQDYVVEVYHDRFAAQHGVATKDKRWGTRVKGDALMADITVERVQTMFDRAVAEHGLTND